MQSGMLYIVTNEHHGAPEVSLERKGKGNSTLLSVIQEDQLDDSWSPVISDCDWVNNPKASREASALDFCAKAVTQLRPGCEVLFQ